MKIRPFLASFAGGAIEPADLTGPGTESDLDSFFITSPSMWEM